MHTAPHPQKQQRYEVPAPDPGGGPLLVRVLVVALAAALGAFGGLAAGVLAWFGGSSPANAVLTGGGAGAGTVALVLIVAGVLRRGV